MNDDLIFAKTFIAVDTDGTIREQSLRGTEAYMSIIDDICTDQYQVARVMKLWNSTLSDHTDIICDEVYDRIINEPGEFIPAFLKEHLNRKDYNILLSVKSHPAHRKMERAEDAADRAHEAQQCAA